MGQSYTAFDKIPITTRYAGKTTILGVGEWMAELPEQQREIVALIDRIYTNAKSVALFGRTIPSWDVLIFLSDYDEKTFAQWAISNAIRIAGTVGFCLKSETVYNDFLLAYDAPDGERLYCIKFIV